ncbi:MAG TPA: SDR family oxidoreductase [Alphaproteobacteria bacterium]|nr:SDR family oxidoreductase [Alphaproteobacteria bacterium]
MVLPGNVTEIPYYLDGKVALVTGASRGLGRHFTRTLSRAGAKVAACGRSQDLLQELIGEITADGGSARSFPLDVTNSANVAATVQSVTKTLGPINILVNNAGIAITKPALDVDEADWDTVIDTNLKGVWLVGHAVARAMVENGNGGKIINIASIASTTVLGRASSYCASKAGVTQLTRALAVEWARHGIQVNAIAPGYIRTDMNKEFFESPLGDKVIERIPQRKIGDPADLDGALMLLASDASRFMTGSIILVDGGHDAS